MNEITSRDLFLLYKPGGSFASENPKALSACFQNRFRKLNISHVTKIFFVQIFQIFMIIILTINWKYNGHFQPKRLILKNTVWVLFQLSDQITLQAHNTTSCCGSRRCPLTSRTVHFGPDSL